MNFVVPTAAISAANTKLFVATRMAHVAVLLAVSFFLVRRRFTRRAA